MYACLRREEKNGADILWVINKMNSGINLHCLRDYLKIRDTVILPLVPPEYIYTAEYNCRIPIDQREVRHAKNAGLDVVVTDHHNIDDVQADCLLINPKRKDCKYPFRDLAGCGVAYKFAQAVQRKAGMPKSAIADILDLAAIGTVGDIVPLIDENRTLVKYGLKEIKKNRRPGLDALIKGISLTPENVASEQIAFGIVPNLNACGRMEDAGIGARLLLAGDPDEAAPLVEKVTSLNRNRKKIQDDTYEECLKLADEQCPGSDFPVIYAGNAHGEK